MTVLSARAARLHERICAGRWYPAYSDRTPKAMEELERAGLVLITGRPKIIEAAYVPARGYTPYVAEKFATRKKTA